MLNFDPIYKTPQKWLTLSAFLVLLLSYHLIFGRLFPDAQGQLGEDYSFILPSLLNGYYWFKTNSFFEVPWFSPAFCGGQPYFADVQSMYYSIPQFLSFIIDPLTSVYFSILLFASAGFWCMYLLLNQIFSLSTKTTLLGSALFMFNGFYTHRMIVGHFGFQGFMLIPLVAYLLLKPTVKEEGRIKLSSLLNATGVGLCLTYWLQSGFTSLIIPGSLAVLAIVCLYSPTPKEWRVFLERSIIASLIALSLCAAKLVAGIGFMSNFQRSDYLLPGIDGVIYAINLLLSALFDSPANPQLTNLQITLGPQEWDFSVTIIPLFLIILRGLLANFFTTKKPIHHKKRSIIALTLLVIILLIPLFLNIYTPQWNAILKQTPILKSSSSLLRWWLIYIPVVIIYASIILERCVYFKNSQTQIVIIGLLGILSLNAFKYHSYFHQSDYRPDTVLIAYQAAANGGHIPIIEQITAITDKEGQILTTINRNDSLASGSSQLRCYNPSFGYGLEKLPFKSLHTGNIYEVSNGELNLKNPACYVFPHENHCELGAHFSFEDKEHAISFAHYKPYTFAISEAQKIANLITKFSLALVSGFLILTAIMFFTEVTRKMITKAND